jgi:DNA recombination protein RmuC
MDAAVFLLFGTAGGVAICWLALRPSLLQLGELKQRVEHLRRELQAAGEARARAEEHAARVPALEAALSEARRRGEDLRAQLADAEARLATAQHALGWQKDTEEAFRTAFKALAADVLQANAGQFLGQARTQLAQLVDPLKATLADLEQHVRDLEVKREGAYHGLKTQLDVLQATARTLALALKSPSARGQWGEVQLRRLVELAGMVEHVDFTEQQTADSARPDLLVYLPQGGVVVVDAKTPMQAFLEAMEAEEDGVRRARLVAHGRALRQHVQHLASKRYWEQFERVPELVVLFIPNDGCLAAAFETDPSLLEDALRQRVLLATPVTLLALLKAVAYGWQQQAVAAHAREIAQQGRHLYGGLVKFLEVLHKMGRRLDSTVKYYNETLGTLERRVLGPAQQLAALGAGGEALPPLPALARAPQVLAVDEPSAGDELEADDARDGPVPPGT